MNKLDILTHFSTRYGYPRWRQVLLTLSFYDNVINGYRIYIDAYHNLSKGKYFTSPADADDLIHKLADENLLLPMSFNPQPERLPAIGLIHYNPRHIAVRLPCARLPVLGLTRPSTHGR